MTAFVESLKNFGGGDDQAYQFNWRQFVSDYITRSPLLTAWLVAITLFVLSYTLGQLQQAPFTTIVVLLLWAGTLVWMIRAELTKNHHPVTLWLKENLYSSITNVLISLFLVLFILWAIRGFYTYAWVNASWSTEADVAAEVTQSGQIGARWGSVLDNFANLLIFRLKGVVPDDWDGSLFATIVYEFTNGEVYRLWATLGMILVLLIPSLVIYRHDKYRGSRIRQILTLLWVISPFLAFYFLRGVGDSGPFYQLDIDQIWGGFLLTVIISVFAIVVSFPFGVLLALGRRSKIQGVPAWLTYLSAAILTIWGLTTSTPESLEAARGTLGVIVAYWPLAIPVIAYALQRTFKGNVVAAASTVYIECVRGVPLITILFMSIILFPIFLPPDMEVLKTTRVMVAFAMFAAAYLAENVRGGLQAIPRGQYEAADSLGLSTFNKYRMIILPQALRLVIPAIVGQFIGLFKDTSLVFLVGLLDFLAVANAISAQPQWLTIRTEPYIFLFIVYFIGSSLMAWYSRRLEVQLAVGQR